MTEASFLWSAPAGAGDGASSFTRTDWSNIMKVIAACFASEGVAAGYLNGLAGSTTGANNARIASGGAIVDGKPYYSNANVDVTIPSAAGGGNTRIDRVVLRADWSAQTVRVTRIAGIDAASPTAPTITQNTGVVYDVLLYKATVNTSGTVTMTDERTFAIPTSAVINTAAITDLAVTTAKIAANAITAAKITAETITANEIANRTRILSVTADNSYNSTDAVAINATQSGINMSDNKLVNISGGFKVPSDYVAGGTLTVSVIIQASGAGNVYSDFEVFGGAAGEATTTNQSANGYTAVAILNLKITSHKTIDLAGLGVQAGDYVRCFFQRDAVNASDTVNALVNFLQFEVSYTADM